MPLNSSPKILGLITDQTFENFEAFREDMGLCDLFELRLDLISGNEEEVEEKLGRLRTEFSAISWLVTDRLVRDGGTRPNEDSEERLERLAYWAQDPQTSWVDLELEEPELVKAFAKVKKEVELDVSLLLSHHNFQNAYNQEELLQKCSEAAKLPVDGFKMALTFQSAEQEKELYTFLKSQPPLPIVAAFSMGELGKRSRIFAPLCGAPFTYGYFGEVPSAPGQWSVKEMKQRLMQMQQNPEFLANLSPEN